MMNSIFEYLEKGLAKGVFVFFGLLALKGKASTPIYINHLPLTEKAVHEFLASGEALNARDLRIFGGYLSEKSTSRLI